MDVLQVFSGDVVQCLITFVRIKPLCEGLVLSSWCTVWDDCSNFVPLLLLFFLLFVAFRVPSYVQIILSWKTQSARLSWTKYLIVATSFQGGLNLCLVNFLFSPMAPVLVSTGLLTSHNSSLFFGWAHPSIELTTVCLKKPQPYSKRHRNNKNEFFL